MLAGKIGKQLMSQVPGGCDDEIGGRIRIAVVILHHLAIKALDGVARTQDRLAERMVLPEIRGEDLMHEIIGIVLVHFEFFEDHALFLDHIVFAEKGV